MRLYWRIVLVNGVVFAIGTSMLAALLIAVSVEILLREAAVLALGAVLLLVVNGLLLRVVLAPLERLREAMSKVDLLKPSRVEAPGIRDFQPLVETFNAMLGR
ncbi:MAG: sensor histidine kinase, partial [Dermatophilaceae bacterium]